MGWAEIKIIINLKCCLLLIYATTTKHQQTISWSDCDMQWKVDCIWQPTANQLSGWIKKKVQSTSQSQTCTKKGCGHPLVVCCQSDPLQLSESQRNHFILEVCSANQWDAPKIAMTVAGLGEQKGPNSSPWQCLNQHFKSWTNWALKCCLIHHSHMTSHQLTATSSS